MKTNINIMPLQTDKCDQKKKALTRKMNDIEMYTRYLKAYTVRRVSIRYISLSENVLARRTSVKEIAHSHKRAERLTRFAKAKHCNLNVLSWILQREAVRMNEKNTAIPCIVLCFLLHFSIIVQSFLVSLQQNVIQFVSFCTMHSSHKLVLTTLVLTWI